MKEWINKAPTKPGFYWFYGDINMGSMGGHYFEKNPILPDPKLDLVEVIKISNGLAAVTDGRFVSLNKFDKKKHCEGYVGYWKDANLPEIPKDKDNLFEKENDEKSER